MEGLPCLHGGDYCKRNRESRHGISPCRLGELIIVRLGLQGQLSALESALRSLGFFALDRLSRSGESAIPWVDLRVHHLGALEQN